MAPAQLSVTGLLSIRPLFDDIPVEITAVKSNLAWTKPKRLSTSLPGKKYLYVTKYEFLP